MTGQKHFAKRVYGVVGIKAVMANFNADFTGRPRRTSRSEYVASSTSLGYSMKKLWDEQGERVFNLRSYRMEGKGNEEALVPRDIKERFERLFGMDLAVNTKSPKIPDSIVLERLFSAVDVMNFGLAFAVAGYNFSITGATQIYEGFNKFVDSREEEVTMTTQFRNAKGDDTEKGAEQGPKRQTTLGSKVVLDRAHYYFSFSINPSNYKEYEDVLEKFEGYTEEAYLAFRNAALRSVTNMTSKSKAGAENEFALFVTCKEGEEVILPALAPYIFLSTDGDTIDVTKVFAVLADFATHIEEVEVFYNPYSSKLETGGGIEGVVYKNIFTGEVFKGDEER